MELWTEKYRPQKSADIVGQSKAVEQINTWMANWKKGSCLLICGPTGTGKTAIPEILCKERGWLLTQLNASDINMEALVAMINSSRSKPLFYNGRLMIIDEIEGVSGNSDRGVMPAVLELVKKSDYPVIVISTDPYIQKLSAVRAGCDIVKLDKVSVLSITKRLKEICMAEGIEADEEALKSLAKFSSGDMRSAIADLQTMCSGRKAVGQKDLEIISYRERGQSVFTALQPIFHSRKVSVGRQAISQADKDADEIFWWIENNLTSELKTPQEIANGYNLLSVADVFRSRTMKQQNWRFKALASDLMASISVFKESHTGFVMYKPPQRLMQLGRTKGSRAALNSACAKLGKLFHCSKRSIRSAYLPYIRFILKNNKPLAGQLGLEKEELKILAS